MKKSKFLFILKEAYDRFMDLLNRTGIERMEEPGVSGVYSLKDITAHVTAYERALVRWLEDARFGRLFIDPIIDHPDVHARNAQIFELNKDRTPQVVIQDFKYTYGQLIEAVEPLTNDELNDEDLTAWFVAPRWGAKRPLWQCIALDSYDHHKQHIPDIESWLEDRQS